MKKSGYLVIFISIIILILNINSRDALVLKNAAGGQIYLLLPVTEGQELTIGWRHSIELQPWEETFAASLEDHRLVLVSTRFRSYGAGVPDESSGSFRLEDGYIEYGNLNRPYDYLPFIHADYGRYWLKMGDSRYDLPTLVPDNTPVILALERVSLGVLYGLDIYKNFTESWELPPVKR